MKISQPIVECVPNFSEGRDMGIIHQITDEIKKHQGVKLLNVDPGAATNRTVVTFVGSPQEVADAAFDAVRKAGQLIDMSRHHGAHPRMGATDVLPLVPVSGITIEECAALARQLARRIADELAIPCYCYEASALKPEHRNLADCRAGEYEALPEKLLDPVRQPDYGSRPFDERIKQTGCTVVGARDFLIAVNFNLNTTSTRRANAIAFDVREKGRPMREGGSLTGKILKDADGNTLMQPGTLKCTKAIGWYIDEYGIAQVSMNMTNLHVTPLHVAFDEVCRCADARGIRVTGTEIVGLIPKQTLIDAGRYFLEKQHRSTGIPEADIIHIAIKSMGLDDLAPFNPHEKVIEYLISSPQGGVKGRLLKDLSVKEFSEETSRESPAPGGGSVAAYMGTLAAALGTMVANLSSHKRGWDDQWHKFSQWADKGQALRTELLRLVDEDTAAFNGIMTAYGLPKATEKERTERDEAIQQATRHAAEVPMLTMRASLEVLELCQVMAIEGNAASVSDVGVGALAARAAVMGASLNVKINADQLKDRPYAQHLILTAEELETIACARESKTLEIVREKIKPQNT